MVQTNRPYSQTTSVSLEPILDISVFKICPEINAVRVAPFPSNARQIPVGTIPKTGWAGNLTQLSALAAGGVSLGLSSSTVCSRDFEPSLHEGVCREHTVLSAMDQSHWNDSSSLDVLA